MIDKYTYIVYGNIKQGVQLCIGLSKVCVCICPGWNIWRTRYICILNIKRNLFFMSRLLCFLVKSAPLKIKYWCLRTKYKYFCALRTDSWRTAYILAPIPPEYWNQNWITLVRVYCMLNCPHLASVRKLPFTDGAERLTLVC